MEDETLAGLPRGAIAYSRVPSFRFPTPPRERGRPGELRGGAPPRDGRAPNAAPPPPDAPDGPSSSVCRAFAEGGQPRPAEAEAEADAAAGERAAPELHGPPLGRHRAGAVVDEEEDDIVEEPAGSSCSWAVAREVLGPLALAYDESLGEALAAPRNATGFAWSSMYDAAHAAWIGGTKLLQYGELLPGGAAKALAVLAAGARPARGDATGATAGLGQLVLELGMGRGRLALQLFLSGATVIGVELASERYGLAVAAMERLAHRSPEDFEIVHRGAQSVRLRRCGGPKSALYEVRLGSFFDVVTDEEIGVATLVFLHVSLPPPTWSRVRGLVARTRAGCRLLAYEDLAAMWERQPDAPPLTAARGVQLACSWAPEEGHRFLLCERVPEPPGGPASSAHEAPAPVAEGSPGGPPWPAEAARSGAAAPPAPVPTAKALSALSAKAAAKRLGRVG